MRNSILTTARPDVLRWAFEVRTEQVASALLLITASIMLLTLSWQDSMSQRARRLLSHWGASCRNTTYMHGLSVAQFALKPRLKLAPNLEF